MPKLYITEFASLGADFRNNTSQTAALPARAEQAIEFTSAASVQSAMLDASTTLVRVHADTSCTIAVGANPTAADGNMRFVSDQTEYFSVPTNSGLKIAVKGQ